MRLFVTDNEGLHWDIRKRGPANVSVEVVTTRGTKPDWGERINHEWHGRIPPKEVLLKMEQEGY